MRTSPIVGGFAALLLALGVQPARAAFHFWDIKEIFSNADGTVQFIEFVCGAFPGEHFLDGHLLSATSDGVTVDYVFTGNLSTLQSTSNRHFLAATAGFGSLAGGVAPDYTLPANFFNPNAASITINFASFTDVVTFSGSALPKDGVNSLTDQSPAGVTNLVAGANSPTNFGGQVGSISLAPPTFAAADFTENGVVNGFDLAVWRANFGLTGTATHRQGDSDDDNDVDGVDFLTWQQQTTGAGSALAAAAAVPEPGAAALAATAMLLAWQRRRAGRGRGQEV